VVGWSLSVLWVGCDNSLVGVRVFFMRRVSVVLFVVRFSWLCVLFSAYRLGLVSFLWVCVSPLFGWLLPSLLWVIWIWWFVGGRCTIPPVSVSLVPPVCVAFSAREVCGVFGWGGRAVSRRFVGLG